jgi:hypothetical protein
MPTRSPRSPAGPSVEAIILSHLKRRSYEIAAKRARVSSWTVRCCQGWLTARSSALPSNRSMTIRAPVTAGVQLQTFTARGDNLVPAIARLCGLSADKLPTIHHAADALRYTGGDGQTF